MKYLAIRSKQIFLESTDTTFWYIKFTYECFESTFSLALQYLQEKLNFGGNLYLYVHTGSEYFETAFDIYLIGSDLCTKDPNPTNFQIVSGSDQNTETRIPDYGYDDRK